LGTGGRVSTYPVKKKEKKKRKKKKKKKGVEPEGFIKPRYIS